MTFEEKKDLVDKIRSREFLARASELRALEKKYGPGVRKVAVEARAGIVEREWREIAATVPERGIRGLVDTLWKGMEDLGFRFTCEGIEKGMQFRVTYCPLADMARRMGLADYGYACYCADDPAIARGFDPGIAFQRTKTLMQGHECCDHRYTE